MSIKSDYCSLYLEGSQNCVTLFDQGLRARDSQSFKLTEFSCFKMGLLFFDRVSLISWIRQENSVGTKVITIVRCARARIATLILSEMERSATNAQDQIALSSTQLQIWLIARRHATLDLMVNTKLLRI